MKNINIFLQEGALDAGALMAWLPYEKHGAQVVFLGAVRGKNDGRMVTGISFDIHQQLAVETLKTIATEAIAASGEQDMRVYIAHAYGEITVGGCCIAIGVTSAHRAAAYEASRYIIEEVKTRVPIWKQEHYADKTTNWLPGHALAG
ncbi:MAG: molybdenum cofactor biosynthesis protein MoaE [Alphaproteobacteria bacterium]|nr:molybdenum cofactor biosynthesis protein MoaE [Alphaproteobacteria bacterium]MDD9919060.1 molybdenum cofactor biosynthesis protein MoaE [Alphaproteobacteria bacterium]